MSDSVAVDMCFTFSSSYDSFRKIWEELGWILRIDIELKVLATCCL